MDNPSRFYLAVIKIIDRRIRALGWTMETCDDRSGNQSGYTAKMLHPGTPSGRQAQWQTLQYLLDALYPGGVRVVIEPLPARKPNRFSMDRLWTRAMDSRKDNLLHFSRRGGLASAAARMRLLTPEHRSAIASKASRARWEKYRAEKPTMRARVVRSHRRGGGVANSRSGGSVLS
jgi:hypothetical protein